MNACDKQSWTWDHHGLWLSAMVNAVNFHHIETVHNNLTALQCLKKVYATKIWCCSVILEKKTISGKMTNFFEGLIFLKSNIV